MSIPWRIIELQEYLPEHWKHRLMCYRRRALWQSTGIIFVHVPKAAGTSVAHSLYGRSMGHMTALDIHRSCPHLFTHLPTFAITRNPWDRLVSAYHFVKQLGTAEAGVNRRPEYGRSVFQNFDTFVTEWLAQQDLKSLDYVFRPQYQFVLDRAGSSLVDFIGKLEDLERVQQFIASSIGKQVQFPAKNPSKRKLDYRNYYADPRVKQVASDLYSRDADLFGYLFD